MCALSLDPKHGMFYVLLLDNRYKFTRWLMFTPTVYLHYDLSLSGKGPKYISINMKDKNVRLTKCKQGFYLTLETISVIGVIAEIGPSYSHIY